MPLMISQSTECQVQVKSYPAQKTITPRILITVERQSQNIVGFFCSYCHLYGALALLTADMQMERKFRTKENCTNCAPEQNAFASWHQKVNRC